MDAAIYERVQSLSQALNLPNPEAVIAEGVRMLAEKTFNVPGRKTVDLAAGRLVLDFSRK